MEMVGWAWSCAEGPWTENDVMSWNVHSLDIVKLVLKTCVILRTPLGSGHILSRSHATVIVSSEFSAVSAEFQTQHCAAFHVRFKPITLRHQICHVRLRVFLHDDQRGRQGKMGDNQ